MKRHADFGVKPRTPNGVVMDDKMMAMETAKRTLSFPRPKRKGLLLALRSPPVPVLLHAEAMVGETTLSRGSDCDAVWFCPRRMKTPIVG
eukprot:scaffold11205_cov221-Skeletonema_dohrnii-CCMP3373.AAC.2